MNVVPASPPDASLRARVDGDVFVHLAFSPTLPVCSLTWQDIEYQRSDKERENVFESVRACAAGARHPLTERLLRKAFAEVRALTDFIVNELEVRAAFCG